MLSKFFTFFIPEKNYKYLTTYEQISYTSRAQLLILLSIVTIMAINLLFMYQLIYLNFGIAKYVAIPAVTIIFIVGIYLTKRTGKIDILTWLFFIIFLTALPHQIYYKGGALTANNLSWYIAGMCIVAAIHSKKVTSIFIVISTIQIISLSFAETPPHSSPTLAKTINFLFAYLVTLLSLWSIFKVHSFTMKETTTVEKIQTINLMITSLSHEINNPLAIAVGYMEVLDEEIPENENLQKIKSALTRITNIVKEIEKTEYANKDRNSTYLNKKYKHP